MKKVLITFLSHVVPTVVLLGLIVFFWKSHTYLIDIPDKIFNPATLHINPIGPKSIIEYMGVWRVLLLGLFVVLAFYFALAFLFRIKIYGNKQFPRKILLGFFLIALGVAAIFGPFIVANIKSTETQKSICSELEQRHDRAVKIMKKLEQNLINKKPDIETINRFFSSNSFDLIANSLSEYNKVISQYEDSVNALRAIYKQVDTLVAVLKTCKCVASEILINLPGFHSPDPDLANYLSERMDKTLSDNRKSWNLDEWWKFLSARYFIGRYSIVYNTERVKFYCELGDSFYKRSQVSAGDQCYKIAAVSMPAEVVKHLNVSLASPILKYHSQILSIIDREKEYSRNLGDFYDAMGAQVFIYYMEANTASFYGKDSLAYEGLGSQSFKILLDQNFAEAMRVLHGKFIYRGSAVPLIKNRVTSLVSLIKNRVTGDDAFKNPTYASDSYFESLNTFAESGELIITKELWSLAVDLDFHYYPLHSSENVITQGMLREEHDMKMCFLRLFGDEIVYDPVKMAWIQRNGDGVRRGAGRRRLVARARQAPRRRLTRR